MIRYSQLVTLALLSGGLIVLNACMNSSDSEDTGPDIVISIQDSLMGTPTSADSVYWSYSADAGASAKASHGEDTTTKQAIRGNFQGSEWSITDPDLHGKIYIRVRHEEGTSDPLCATIGRKTVAVDADSLPQNVVVKLNVYTICAGG